MVTRKLKRAIGISVYDETEAPEVTFTGDWRMRDLGLLERHILRAYNRMRKERIVKKEEREIENDGRTEE